MHEPADRGERLARNEAIFREVNERIASLARDLEDAHDVRPHVFDFLCECSRPGCVERIRLSRDEYEAARARGDRFIVIPGHELAAVEDVVAESGEAAFVEKTGRAGEIARELDPRGL